MTLPNLSSVKFALTKKAYTQLYTSSFSLLDLFSNKLLMYYSCNVELSELFNPLDTFHKRITHIICSDHERQQLLDEEIEPVFVDSCYEAIQQTIIVLSVFEFIESMVEEIESFNQNKQSKI